jgi:hypothetical protein
LCWFKKPVCVFKYAAKITTWVKIVKRLSSGQAREYDTFVIPGLSCGSNILSVRNPGGGILQCNPGKNTTAASE